MPLMGKSNNQAGSFAMKNVALFGGMQRLEHHYRDEAARVGVRLEVVNSIGKQMVRRIRGADAVAIFSGQVSHKLREVVVKAAEAGGVPVFFCHTCGICALRECLSKCLKNENKCFLREKVSNLDSSRRPNGSEINGNAKKK